MVWQGEARVGRLAEGVGGTCMVLGTVGGIVMLVLE